MKHAAAAGLVLSVALWGCGSSTRSTMPGDDPPANLTVPSSSVEEPSTTTTVPSAPGAESKPTTSTTQEPAKTVRRQVMAKRGAKDAALIVAIEDYDRLPDIAGARRNASDWESFLVRDLGLQASAVEVLKDDDAALESVREALKRATSRVPPGGRLWFVFVGHGAPMQGADGTSFGGGLVGVDARQSVASLRARSLARSELLTLLGQGKQAETVVLLDACFSARSRAGHRRRLPSPRTPSERPSTSSIATTFQTLDDAIEACASSSNRSGFKGTFKLAFKIAPSGKVRSVKSRQLPAKASDVGRCVVKKARALKFDASRRGTTTVLPVKLD